MMRGCDGARVRVLVRMVVGMLQRFRFTAHAKLRRRHSCARDPLGPDGIPINREAAERTAQIVERKTRIEQRAENHVAGGAGETIEVQNLQTRPSYPVRGPAPSDLEERGHSCCRLPDSTSEKYR